MDVREDHPRFVEAGGQVAVVTMATVEQNAAFREKYKLPFPCLSDPEREAYGTFRLGHGTVGQVAGPRVWLPGLKAIFRAGAGRPSGDIWQMPGTFVIDREGIVRLAHYPTHSADHAKHADIVDALQTPSESQKTR